MLKVFQTLRPEASNAIFSPRKVTPLREFARLRTAIVLSFLALGLGCGDPDRARIVGRWEVSAGDGMLDRVDKSAASEMPSESDPSLEDTDQAPRLVVEFFQSGSLQTETRISDAISQKNGTWSLLKFDDDKKVAHVKCELIGQTTEHAIFLVSENEILMVPPNLAGLTKKMRFKRK